MTYSNILQLKTYLLNAVENLEAAKQSKDYAANARMWGAMDYANEFTAQEVFCEELLIKNMTNAIKYIKENMNDVSENHANQLLNNLS